MPIECLRKLRLLLEDFSYLTITATERRGYTNMKFYRSTVLSEKPVIMLHGTCNQYIEQITLLISDLTTG